MGGRAGLGDDLGQFWWRRLRCHQNLVSGVYIAQPVDVPVLHSANFNAGAGRLSKQHQLIGSLR